MKQIVLRTFQIPGSNHKPICLDITYDHAKGKQPVILYAHGFNGFKDWGQFNLIAQEFALAGFAFIKFNFSHNGTSPQEPETFVDLDAFAENNYTRELEDLEMMIDWITRQDNPCAAYLDNQKIGLIGHSMGGGISIIKASENNKISALNTWASISVCRTPWGNWTPQQIEDWRASGVRYYLNGRTGQQMPMNYQLFEDYQNNRVRLDIIQAARKLHIPFLICHGTLDNTVPLEAAQALHQANPAAELFLVDSDHVFGRSHPWVEKELPQPMQKVLHKSIAFFGQTLGN